jgi:hypothetical protein
MYLCTHVCMCVYVCVWVCITVRIMYKCVCMCVCRNVHSIHKCVYMYMHTFAIYNIYAHVVHTHFSAPLPYTPPHTLLSPPHIHRRGRIPGSTSLTSRPVKKLSVSRFFSFPSKDTCWCIYSLKQKFKRNVLHGNRYMCMHTHFTTYHIPYTLSLSHTHTHTLSHTHAYPLSFTHTRTHTYHISHTAYPLSLSHTDTYTQGHTTYLVPHTRTQSHTHTRGPTTCHIPQPLSLSLSLSLSHTHTHSGPPRARVGRSLRTRWRKFSKVPCPV